MKAAGRRYIMYGSCRDTFRIWNLADLHWMSRACAEGRIKKDIQTIRDDPFSFWLGGGDYCDFIGYSDKRFDPDAVAEWVSVKDLGELGQKGMREIAKLFAPIKDKCFGLLLGNHEKKYELQNEQESLHGWLCTELGVANLGYSALFDVVFARAARTKRPRLVDPLPRRADVTSRVGFRLFAHHGAGYAQTPGGKLNRLVQFMQSFDADIYFAGHVHDRVARSEPAIGADRYCKELTQRLRLGTIAGSYLKTYEQGVTTYGEQRGYRPTSLGAAVVQVCPETRELKAEV